MWAGDRSPDLSEAGELESHRVQLLGGAGGRRRGVGGGRGPSQRRRLDRLPHRRRGLHRHSAPLPHPHERCPPPPSQPPRRPSLPAPRSLPTHSLSLAASGSTAVSISGSSRQHRIHYLWRPRAASHLAGLADAGIVGRGGGGVASCQRSRGLAGSSHELATRLARSHFRVLAARPLRKTSIHGAEDV